MGNCYISRRGAPKSYNEQVGIYPIGANCMPTGNVIIPSHVTSITNSSLFRQNNLITSISLPPHLKTIANGAFSYCSSLLYLEIPDDVTIIPTEMCYNCNNLTRIKLSKNCTTIGSNAFYNCPNLSEIEIPEEITSIILQQRCFGNDNALTNNEINKIGKIINSVTEASVFSGLNGITNVQVNVTGDSYFSNCQNLLNVLIVHANNSNSFGESTFYQCVSLKKVQLPEEEGILIGSSMFNGCNKLTDINIPNTCKTIGTNAFYNCTSLRNIKIPKSITQLQQSCFNNCTSLFDIEIEEDTLFTPQASIFTNCSSLPSEIVEKVTTHCMPNNSATSLFQNCLGLRDIICKKWLSNNMFSNCTNLKTALCELTETSIGSNIFQNCTSLKEVHITGSPTSIYNSVFYGCTSLEIVYLPGTIITQYNSSLTNTGSNNIFYQCTNLKEIILGKGWSMSIYMSQSSNLTRESLIQTFENLKDFSGEQQRTITIGNTNKNKLTKEDLAIATNKNWIIN